MPRIVLTQAEEVYYELIGGEQEKPYLVFLHEGLGCTEMWMGFPRALCRETGCPGIVYDRLGYGRSSPLARPRTIHYLHEYALVELPEVLSRLIPGRKYFIVGHSDGGSIALIHAAARPAALQGVIAEAAHVFVEQETLVGIRSAVDAFDAGKLRGLSRYHGERTEAVFRAWSDTWLSAWFRHWNIEYLLPSIECPVLVLQGAGDQYATLAQVDTISSKTAGAQRVVIEDCGHAPHQEKPEVTLRLMKEFLEHHIHAESSQSTSKTGTTL